MLAVERVCLARDEFLLGPRGRQLVGELPGRLVLVLALLLQALLDRVELEDQLVVAHVRLEGRHPHHREDLQVLVAVEGPGQHRVVGAREGEGLAHALGEVVDVQRADHGQLAAAFVLVLQVRQDVRDPYVGDGQRVLVAARQGLPVDQLVAQLHEDTLVPTREHGIVHELGPAAGEADAEQQKRDDAHAHSLAPGYSDSLLSWRCIRSTIAWRWSLPS